MVQVLRRGQAPNKVVSVAAIVGGALDLAQMRHLVQHGGSLVLGVASAAQRGQAGEEQRAVDHLAGRGVRVCQHAVGAGAEDVGAVVPERVLVGFSVEHRGVGGFLPAVAGGGGAALAGHVVEHACDG